MMELRSMISLCALFIIACLCIDYCAALECYICDNQDENQGKCTKSIKTCDYGEDVCLTEIRWGSTPYWTQGALKQHYISKRCSTRDQCERYRDSNMKLCTHTSYEDWKCSDCCKGDRCNYYIISGAMNQHNMVSVGVISILTWLFIH